MNDDIQPIAPLAGVLVADLSQVLAGPLATMVLADLGAEVVKVEPPGGDATRSWGPPWRGDESTYSLAVNRGKRSVILDLTDPDDRRLALRLIDRSDVLVTNLRPGGAQRLGLDDDDLAQRNPRLIRASVTGFGASPQAAGLGGYDLLVQAMSGLMSVTGAPDGEPTKVGVALVDVVTGLYTAVGILAALQERVRSGQGQRVEVSLFGASLASLVNQASAYLGAGVVPQRLGNQHPSIVPYETVSASDRPLVVAVGSDRLFMRLCDVIGQPALADDPRFATNAARVAHREALLGVLDAAFARRTAGDWTVALRDVGVPAGLVNDVAEAFAEAAALGLDAIVPTLRGDGDVIDTVRSPMRLSRTPTVVPCAPPRLGADDLDVRAWLDAEQPGGLPPRPTTALAEQPGGPHDPGRVDTADGHDCADATDPEDHHRSDRSEAER